MSDVFFLGFGVVVGFSTGKYVEKICTYVTYALNI